MMLSWFNMYYICFIQELNYYETRRFDNKFNNSEQEACAAIGLSLTNGRET